jgi:hypothetical protein
MIKILKYIKNDVVELEERQRRHSEYSPLYSAFSVIIIVVVS